MEGVHPVVVAVAAVWAVLALTFMTWLFVQVRAVLRRRREARALSVEVLDLTFFEQAVRRTEAAGRAASEIQLRTLGMRRSG